MSTPPARPPEARDDESGWSLVRLWQAVLKHWVLVAALGLVAAVGTGLYTLRQPRIYRTSASVLIDPNPPRPLGKEVPGVIDVGAGAYWTNREYYETQFQLMKSRRVALLTVQQLALHRDPTFVAGRRVGTAVEGGEVSPDTAASILMGRLLIEPVKGTRLVNVSLEDADPERARRVLTTHLDLYIQQNLDDAVATSGTAADWMRDQLVKLKSELEDNELALHEYKKDKRILSVSLDDQNNMLREEMTQLNGEVTRVKAERERLAARLAELEKVRDDDPDSLPARELIDNAAIASLRAAWVEARRDRATQIASGKGENHPDVLSATARVETSKRALLSEVRNVQGAVRRDFAAVTRQATGLAGLYENAKQRALDLNLLEIEYRRLERSKKNTERLFSLVLERSKDSDLTSQMRFNNIRVVDGALMPGGPVRPNVPLNIGGGLVAGLVLGLVLAVVREMTDRTVKGPEDIEKGLGLTYIGLLPRVGAAGATAPRYGRRRRAPAVEGRPELSVHADPTSGMAEAARAVRTNILFMSPDEPFRRLLVTSAVPSEGKTTVACSVAITMAQAGQRVCLIDCDLRRPRLHKVFDLRNDRGVTTLLLDPEALAGTITETTVPGLSVLPSGPLPPNPAELLHSEAFGRLLEELEQRFDRIVVDSPPLVPVADAAVLGTRVSATLIVVKPFRTSKDLVRHAARALSDVGARILGCVLNDVDLERGNHGYYYSGYYAYRRDGYAARESTDSSAAS